jgi:hypothetical protein
MIEEEEEEIAIYEINEDIDFNLQRLSQEIALRYVMYIYTYIYVCIYMCIFYNPYQVMHIYIYIYMYTYVHACNYLSRGKQWIFSDGSNNYS